MTEAQARQGTVAVTGASGFVGRRLVDALLGRGLVVRALVPNEAEAARVPSGAEVRLWDVTRSGDTAGTLEGVRGLCHLAAFLPPSYADPAFAATCLDVNALGTLTLLQAAVGAGVGRLVHFSSGNVYRRQTAPVGEDAVLYPSAQAPYYLASKLCGEIFATHFLESGRLDVAVLRPSSVYGPGMVASGLVPTFASRLRTGQEVTVQDGGLYRTDLVYVDDVVEVAAQALLRDVRGAFNVGSGRAWSVLEVAETLIHLLGCDPSLVRVEPPSATSGAKGFAPLDIRRARRELDYAPRDLEQGLRGYLASLAEPERPA
jgi:UDP-glucose 4-epimerase